MIFIQQIIFCIYGKTKAALELTFSTILGSMALACQDMYDVEIADGVIVPVSHFHMILARSGSRKTTVYRLAMAQIHQIEHELAEAFSVRLEEYKRQYVLWDEECKSLKKSLQKAVRQKEGVEEARYELEEWLKNEPIKPVRVRLTVTDPTPEAILKELGEYSCLGKPLMREVLCMKASCAVKQQFLTPYGVVTIIGSVVWQRVVPTLRIPDLVCY